MSECLHQLPSSSPGIVQCEQGLFRGTPTLDQCAHCVHRNERPRATGADATAAAGPSHPERRVQRSAPVGKRKDANDDRQARWGRQRHDGFPVGRYLQPPPLLFTADHHPLWLGDLYRGRSAFLICGGPSFASLDHEPLRRPGVLTMGLNNSVKTFRPNLWVSVDDPSHFIRSIWLDPVILKFVPICHAEKPIFDNDAWQWTEAKVRDCPAVVYYKRNEHFRPRQFLWEDTLNWGNHKRQGGGRSVMLPAIRILFLLGVRRVFLLGADFTMTPTTKYHFPQQRSASSIRGNNSTYAKLNDWFAALRPLFAAEGFDVFNCNEASRLTAFDFIRYEEALSHVMGPLGGINLAAERTEGLYDMDKGRPRPGGRHTGPRASGERER